jgi:V/A-type H+-transporting ATPase subunit K
MGLVFVILGAALAAALAGVGSAIGVGIAGKAATAVAPEKPDSFGKFLLLVALPGSQGIYGFVIAILALIFSGVMGGGADISTQTGLAYFGACLPMALGGLFSAIAQGQVAGSSIIMTGKKESLSGKGVLLAGLVETYAILALLVSIILMTTI